jgi:hypothetical protein
VPQLKHARRPASLASASTSFAEPCSACLHPIVPPRTSRAECRAQDIVHRTHHKPRQHHRIVYQQWCAPRTNAGIYSGLIVHCWLQYTVRVLRRLEGKVPFAALSCNGKPHTAASLQTKDPRQVALAGWRGCAGNGPSRCVGLRWRHCRATPRRKQDNGFLMWMSCLVPVPPNQ